MGQGSGKRPESRDRDGLSDAMTPRSRSSAIAGEVGDEEGEVRCGWLLGDATKVHARRARCTSAGDNAFQIAVGRDHHEAIASAARSKIASSDAVRRPSDATCVASNPA